MAVSYQISVTNLVTNKELTNNLLFAHESCKIKVTLKNDWKTLYRNTIRWDMGDGTIIKGTSATHYYKFPGKFRITCTLYNIDGSPVENSLYTDVIVKEVIPTELSFVDPASWK